MESLIQHYQQSILAATDAGKPLRVRAGGTKDFYGGALLGDVLDVSGYSGVIDYEPKELVLTVRAGTPLNSLEAVLREAGQMLPFEPPHFGAAATIGGAVACGFSGPRRPYAGAARDFVLGARILNGKGEDLHFGGRVIKNVAGFDVSRLMVGALGTLGVLLDLSFKVLPRPQAERTLRFEMNAEQAIHSMNSWAGQPLPLSATSYYQGELLVRFAGAQVAVDAAQAKLGGEVVDDAAAGAYWQSLREQTQSFFAANQSQPLWRASVPSTAPALTGIAEDDQLIEWGGGQRWLRGAIDGAALRAQVASLGGHATCFRGGAREHGVFHPLEPAVAKIHKRLKASFDPADVFNRNRMYDFSRI